MRRHLPRLLLTGALLAPASLYALGLGEIRLHSALNQPFDAEIELISPTPEELVSLKVGLASRELFSRLNLERPAYLSSFDFAVSRTRDGRASIRVTSNRSVTEPYVTLLVEASWARGRLLREYTVLLDPPVFMPSQSEAAAPVTTPLSGAASEGRIERADSPQAQPAFEAPAESAQTPEAASPSEAQTRPIEEAEAAPEPAPFERPSDEPTASEAPAQRSGPAPAEPAGAAMGAEYTVRRNDALWRIASTLNPGSPSMVNRTMIALFRANPQAFYGDNINRLRAGAVLRVPELAEIEAISAREATAEVARQTTQWSAAVAASDDGQRERLELQPAPESFDAPIAASPSEDRPSAQTAPQGEAGAPASASGDRRLPVVDPDLAAAQRTLGGESADSTAEPAFAEEGASQPEPAAQSAEEPAAQQPVRRPRPAPRPQAQPEPPAPTLAERIERIGQFWWVPVVAGLLLVIGLVIAVVRRRRDSDPGGPDPLEPLRFEPGFEDSAPRGREPVDALFAAFDSPARPEVRTTTATTQREPMQSAAATSASLSSGTGSSEEQDALAEADFHMAYGLYDQAADLVKIALGREPQRRDLKLKLLEIYFVWGARDQFLETARELHASRAQAAAGEWDKVLIMGKQIAPEEALFQGGASGGIDLVDVNLEGGEHQVDVDLFAEPGAEKPAGLDLEFASGVRPALDTGADVQGGGDLDFLLDEPQRGASDEPMREMDRLARQAPALDAGSQSIREGRQAALSAGAEQTAELAVDDLDLDLSSLEQTGSLEDSQGITMPGLSEDELTQLAPSMRSYERGAQAAHSTSEGEVDIESSGTIYLDHVDLSANVQDAGRGRAAGDASDIDFDLSSGLHSAPETIERPRPGEADVFSMDVFADRTAQSPSIDLDVGEPLFGEDNEPTDSTNTMELSEDEPVTMSEVGTKLDLARAYMDMGDPEGARSILEEVLAEGNPGQQQEAQRLIDSLR